MEISKPHHRPYDSYIRDHLFWVIIDSTKYSFSKLSGLESSFSSEMYMEGGADVPVWFKTNQTEVHTMKLERGVRKNYPMGTNSAFVDTFGDMPVPGTRLNEVEIIVLGRDGKCAVEYYIPGALVTKWELNQFDANAQNMLIEVFEFQYTKIQYMSL